MAKRKPKGTGKKLFHVYAAVVGSKYIGEYMADSAEEAEEMAWEDAYVSLCHQCSEECENAEIERLTVEEDLR